MNYHKILAKKHQDRKKIQEQMKDWPKCPNCGHLLDINGCCKHCNICIRK